MLSEKMDQGDSLIVRILCRKYLHLRGLLGLLICSKKQLAQTPCWSTPMEQLVLDQFSSAILGKNYIAPSSLLASPHFSTMKRTARDVTQLAERLLSLHKALGSIPRTT